MPVYEYKCSECKTKFDIFHKTLNDSDTVSCPKCGSQNNKKLLSTFSANVNSSGGYSSSGYEPAESPSCSSCGCGSGSCDIN